MPQQMGNITGVQPGARAEVISAIRGASEATGVDFAYLLEEARTESSLNPQAQASTSSARGLYQFIESTWLEMVDRHGGKYGLQAEAAAITRNAKGKPVVQDPRQREAILKLREDPRVSSLMAAELAKDNQVVLERKLGREVGSAELYMAHFLGAGHAARFLTSLEQNPDVEADYIVPGAARANQAVFYRGGQPLTLNQVYARFESKFEIREPTLSPPLPGFDTPPPELLAEAADSAPQRQVLAATAVAPAPLPEPAPAAPGQPRVQTAPRPETQALFDSPAASAMLALQQSFEARRSPEINLYPPTPSRPLPPGSEQDFYSSFQSDARTLMAMSLLQSLSVAGQRDRDDGREWIV